MLDGVEFDDVAQIECSGPDGEIEVEWLEDAQRMADAAAFVELACLDGGEEVTEVWGSAAQYTVIASSTESYRQVAEALGLPAEPQTCDG